MQLEVKHPDFQSQRLEVKCGSLFSGSKLKLNGTDLKKVKGIYTVRADNGKELSVQLKHNFLDPIPKVKIEGKIIELATPLTWFEYIWIGIPILLIFVGGAIGGVCGGLAATGSGRLFRSDRSAVSKYGLSALLTLGAALCYVILVTVIHFVLETT